MDVATLIYSDELARFDYGDDHPFKPMRARNTLELCNRYGLLYARGVSRAEPRPADLEQVRRFHDPAYLEVLQRSSAGQYDLGMLERGIGTQDCPPLPRIYEFSLLATGATLMAAQLVADHETRRAFSMIGGFHHAQPDAAEGFSYINDVGVTLAWLRDRGLRVALVDVDAHHCNGVQGPFYEDDGVLVISLHESGETLYPWGGSETEIGRGSGRGFNVNVPLAARTDDEVYVDVFRRVVPPLLEAYSPDLVLAEIGADTLLSDPLTHLRLTNNGYRTVVDELCRCSPNLVALGGGGYDVFRTSRAWTLAWASMAELEPEDDYAGLVGGMMYGAELDGLQDRQVLTQGEAKQRARAQADRVVRYIHEHVFPRVGAKR